MAGGARPGSSGRDGLSSRPGSCLQEEPDAHHRSGRSFPHLRLHRAARGYLTGRRDRADAARRGAGPARCAGRLVTGGHEPAGISPAGRSPAHGFCDDEATRRLLRSRPPRQALAWAAARLGGPVVSARALRGGMSSAVHLLTVADGADGAGQRRQAVLRRYVRPELNAEEPDIAEREARALRVAGSAGVPTPLLLAVDPAGAEAGA